MDESQSVDHILGEPRAHESAIEITVCEGRKHFVKRLLEAVGHPVRRLARISFGPYQLRGTPVGEIQRINFLPLDAKPGDDIGAATRARMSRRGGRGGPR